MTLTQVAPHSLWPGGDGWTIAGLSATPGELTSGYGLHFEQGLDEFDRFSLAAVDDGHGGQVWFFRYANSPEPGVEVIVDTDVSRDAALRRLEAEGLPVGRLVMWKAPMNADPRNAKLRRRLHRAAKSRNDPRLPPEVAAG
jgi:hypothetical protein